MGGISVKDIPKYYAFFEEFYNFLMKHPELKYLKEMIANARRDHIQQLLIDFDYGYCPAKGAAPKYLTALTINVNFNKLEKYYDKFVSNYRRFKKLNPSKFDPDYPYYKSVYLMAKK